MLWEKSWCMNQIKEIVVVSHTERARVKMGCYLQTAIMNDSTSAKIIIMVILLQSTVCRRQTQWNVSMCPHPKQQNNHNNKALLAIHLKYPSGFQGGIGHKLWDYIASSNLIVTLPLQVKNILKCPSRFSELNLNSHGSLKTLNIFWSQQDHLYL